MIGLLIIYALIGVFVLIFTSNDMIYGNELAVGRAVMWPVITVILLFKALVYVSRASYKAVMRSIG